MTSGSGAELGQLKGTYEKPYMLRKHHCPGDVSDPVASSAADSLVPCFRSSERLWTLQVACVVHSDYERLVRRKMVAPEIGHAVLMTSTRGPIKGLGLW